MKTRWRISAILLAVSFSLVSAAASAQWVLVGRKVVGKITTLTQPKSPKSPGYDVATVLLEAEADKVYATALSLLQQNPQMKILQQSERDRTLEFTDGTFTAGLRITEMGEKSCQVLIASAAGPGTAGGTSQVVDAVQRICDKLGVKYTLDP